jgi:uncharacterized phage protein gp47/JayE
MTFAAEPYGIFVDDLVSALTGGVVREELVFDATHAPYRLGAGAGVVAETVRVHGLAGDAFTRFRPGVDFDLDREGTIVWKTPPADGPPPSPTPTLPDVGSHFYASYERKPDTAAPPRLTDRNPGSVVRTLAESFAREYAVLSRQLERVYEAGFVETAEGRDLDQVVALVGVERRTHAFATGELVFSRATPAPANVFIPAGTLVSTSEVPAVTVETEDGAMLRAGSLSVSVPVRATVRGPDGVAAAATLTVIHRPILGVDAVTNSQAMSYGGAPEPDDALRARATRALEAAGGATLGALTGALTTIAGIREQDIRIVEDHVSAPGTVQVSIAADLDETHARAAAELIEQYRPAGIRVSHNLKLAMPSALLHPPLQGASAVAQVAPAGGAAPVEGVWFPVVVAAIVTPTAATLTATQKAALATGVRDAISGYVNGRGVGERIVKNRLVRDVMAIEGVYDVSIDVKPRDSQNGSQPASSNLDPPNDRRPTVAPADLTITVAGAVIALDVSVRVVTVATEKLANVREEVADLLDKGLPALTQVTEATLRATLDPRKTGAKTYGRIDDLSYRAEFLDEGLRVGATNKVIEPADGQQLWIRQVLVSISGT